MDLFRTDTISSLGAIVSNEEIILLYQVWLQVIFA